MKCRRMSRFIRITCWYILLCYFYFIHSFRFASFRCEWPIETIEKKGVDGGNNGRLSLVISHCSKNLDWLKNFTEGFEIRSLWIYSKCENAVLGAPPSSKIKRLENKGRNDASFLYHILKMTRDSATFKSDDVILFLKDNRETDKDLKGRWRTLQEMADLNKQGNFACALDLCGSPLLSVSHYHNSHLLGFFNLSEYTVHEYRYNKNASLQNYEFKSKFENLRAWFRHIHLIQLPHYVPVCYGGSFMTSWKSIQKTSVKRWEQMYKLLLRNDNIEESHFMERSWAILLSNSLSNDMLNKMQQCKNSYMMKGPMIGAVLKDECL
jgi:hypothetical protein